MAGPWEKYQKQGGEQGPWTKYAVQPQHPEFDASNIPGYNPKTGMVDKYGKAGSAAMGAADTVTFGWGDELASLLGSALTGTPREQVLSQMRGNANEAFEANPGSYIGGQVGGGVAQALATGGLGFGTGAARAGGGLGKVALGSAVDGAIAGGAYGAGSADEGNRLGGAGIGAVTGGIGGLAAPLIAAGATKAVRKAITPFQTGPERTAAIRLLQREGVPLTAGQKSGSNALRYAESELGGSKAANLMEQQGEAFTDAAMRKAGGSGRATSDNMARLHDQIGKQFEDISSRNTLRVDQTIANDMNAAAQEYAEVLPVEQKEIFRKLGDDIVARFKAGRGTMTGKEYQKARSRLSRMAKNYRERDPDFAEAIRGLRNALDNGMDRSINPADKGAWATARKRYGNLKTLEKAAATAGGENAGLGLISPAQLRNAAAQGNRGAYARGEGDFADLAKAGQAVMTQLPNSGTAGRLRVQNLGALAPMIVGSSAGGAYGAKEGGWDGALMGAALGAAAPRMAGKVLMSKPAQAYLSNQVMKGGGNPVRDAILAALLRQGALPPMIEGL